MGSRAERFDDLVLDSVARLERAWVKPLPPVDVAVEDVPPGDPAPWEHAEVALGRLFAAQGDRRARVVIYRRPVETRAESSRELSMLVGEVVTEQVAALLGVAPEDLDPRYEH